MAGLSRNIGESVGRPGGGVDDEHCDHGVAFDKDRADAENLAAHEVRSLWPRMCGLCPRGCGFSGIAYASHAHYIYGDW